jgi:hypothetical protein
LPRSALASTAAAVAATIANTSMSPPGQKSSPTPQIPLPPSASHYSVVSQLIASILPTARVVFTQNSYCHLSTSCFHSTR